MDYYWKMVYLLWALTSSIVVVLGNVEVKSSSKKYNESQTENYGYRIESFSRCSVPCGGGLQTAVFVCYDKTTSLRVRQHHCQNLKSPIKYQRKCNKWPCIARPCPSCRWTEGEWGPCSKSCGQGTMLRKISCQDNDDKIVSAFMCVHFKVPQWKRLCSQVDCQPKFVFGSWSQCSTRCGTGSKQRNVTCIQVLGNGSTVELSHSNCSGMVPASTIPCKDLTGCDTQGDAPIDQEIDYDDSDAFGSGEGESTGKDAPNITLDKQQKYLFKKPSRYQVKVGTKVWAVKKSEIKVKCEASGEKPEITWSRDGYPVTEYFEDDAGIDKDGDLLITDVDRFNEGVYICKAKSKAGGVSTAKFELTIFSINKPYILSEDTKASFGPSDTNVVVTVGGTVTVHTGTTLTIKCPVTGKPTPRVFWLSQGRPISVGQAKTVGNNLKIEKVNKIYALKYSCNARNRLGRAQAFTLVKVLDLSPPQIAAEKKTINTPQSSNNVKITIGTNITVVAGVNLGIQCPIKTKPAPFVSWSARGQTVTGRVGPVTVADDKSRMIISDMKVVYTGLYGCQAKNAAGRTQEVSYVIVLPPSEPTIQSKTGFKSSLEKDHRLSVTIGQQITGLVGTAVTILCPSKGLPEPTITWQINKRPIRLVDRRFTIKGQTLTIKKLVKAQNGKVACTAQNRVGKASNSSVLNVIEGRMPKIASKKGRVSGIAGVEEASITIGQDLRVVQGMIFRVQCPVNGFPTPRVTWSRNDKDVQSSDRILLDKNNNDLIINGIQKEDTGQYMCTAVNPLGEVRESSYVSIIGEESVSIDIGNSNIDTSDARKPVKIKVGDTLKVLSGTDVTIQCAVTGIPAPYVLWRSKDERIESGDRKGQLTLRKQNTLLNIFQVDQKVAGKYECIATNLGGAERATSLITVIDSVSPIIDLLSARVEQLEDLSMVKTAIGASIFMLAGAPLSIACPAKGVPSPTFSWHFKNRPIKPGGRFSLIGHSLVINKTRTSDSGRYFCTATNVVGKEQRYSDVKISAPIKPRILGSPRNINVQVQSVIASEVGSVIRSVEGASLRLSCRSRGLPKPTIHWRFGEIVVAGNLLKLPKLNPGDSKKYTCEARNLAGVVRKTTLLSVIAVRKPDIMSSKDTVSSLAKIRPITTVIGQTVTVIQGSVVTLICSAKGYPTPSITWSHKRVAIQNLADKRGIVGRRVNATYYLLKIDTKFKSKDLSGKYDCVANNIGGTAKATTNLIVKVPSRPAIKSTTVTGSLGRIKALSSRDPISITIGDRAELLTKTQLTIKCPVVGLPSPKIRWFADRRRITYGNKFSLQRGTHLILGSDRYPTTVFDSKRYGCSASNRFGSDSAYSRVRFIKPIVPKIFTVSGSFNFPVNTTIVLTIGSSVTAVTGSILTLTCEASGLPKPKLVWRKDDVIIKSRNNSSLFINGTKKSDSGVYECTATNLAGSRSERSSVKIEDIKEKTEKPHIFRSNQSIIASENKVSFTFVVGANITILEGKDLVLRCPTIGLPKPKVTWMFNNTQVVESDTLSVSPLTGEINIIEMTREETGMYQCISKNIAGQDVAATFAVVVGPKTPVIKSTSNVYFRLDPKRKPIKINIGDSLTTFKGTPVAITCPSTGFPDPRVRWNQNEVSLAPQISIFLNGSMLILTNPEVDDTGKYSCLASNPGGSTNASSNITILAPKRPQITTEPSEIVFLRRGKVSLRIGSSLKVLEGNTIEILCDATGVPKPVLKWRKDRNVLRFSKRKLLVKNIRVRDSGRVICEATNYYGKDMKTTKIIVVGGRKPLIRFSPKSITHLSDYVNTSSNVGATIKVLERSNVQLWCKATGIPKPTYSWSRNQKPIINNKRISFNSTTGVLDIKSATVQDSGRFACRASNAIGWNQRGSTITVSAVKAPVITASKKLINTTATTTINSQIGDTVSTLVNTTITINCPVKGFPSPVRSWTHNGLPIKGRRFSVKGSKLTITKAQLVDEGVYACMASNPGGKTTAKTEVTLDAGNKPSISRSDDVIFDQSGFVQSTGTIGSPISLLSGSGLKLNCPATGLPIPKVVWKVDGRVLSAGPGVVIDSVNRVLIIKKLNRRHSNRVITCTAVNTLGSVSASSKLSVTDPIAPKIATSTAKLLQLDNQNPVSLPIGSTIRILAGTAVSLVCKTQGLPKPEVTWVLANIPVSSESQVMFDDDTLKILDAGKEYGGKYTCKATSPVGMATASSTLRVDEPTGPFIESSTQVLNTLGSTKPISITIGANLTALSSTNISIDCTATGLPVPVTSFSKDGAIINKDNVITQGSKLVITNARFADSGVYACRGRSLAGDATVISHINIIAGIKPVILSSDEVESHLYGFTNLTVTVGASVSILSGSGIRLLCPVRGIPRPVVAWRVESKSKTNHALFDKITNSLTIPRLVPKDFGNYICMAKNILGETSSSSAVNVIEPFGPKIDSSKQSIAVLKVDVPAKIRIGAKVRVLSGVTLSIICKAVGLPLPNITWTMNGVLLESKNHVTVKGELLEIVNSGAEDSGQYVCTASSVMGKDTAQTVLTVQSGKKARITTAGRKLSLLTGIVTSTAYISDNITILKGSELSIMCPTEGIPEPTISFLYDGKPIVPNKRTKIDLKKKTIRIKNIAIKDSGTITCIAKNARGEDRKSTILNVLVPFGPTMKTSKKPIDGLKSTQPVSVTIGSSVKVLVNATIIVNCEVSGLPIPKVFWKKDGKTITSRGHVTIDKDALRVNKALLSDQGVYSCTAHSDVGSVSGVSRVIVKEPIPPSIKSSNKTITSLTRKPVGIVIGETVNTLTRIEFNITCEVEGLPQPEIVWKKNGVALPADGRTFINGPLIYVTGTLASDTGYYVCEATNVAGNKTVVSKLNIQEPIQPEINSTDDRKLLDLRPVTITTEVGTFIKTLETSNITLSCKASGFPTPIITWKKGIETLKAHGNKTSYTISNAKVGDSGIYTCTASNLKGFDFRTSNVTIVAPSSPVIHSAHQNLTALRIEPVTTNVGKFVTTLTGNAITLKCNATGIPKPLLQWFKNGQKLEGSGMRLIITRGKQSDSGFYSCAARNLAGTAKATTELTILDGKPPSILTSNETISKTTQIAYTVAKVGGTINTLLSANVEIACQVSGFPPPKVTWFKGDNEVRKDPTVFINEKGSLMFVSVALRRSGIYKCVATNPIESASATTDLNVKGLKHPFINSSRGVIANLQSRDHYRIIIGQDLTVLAGSNISVTCSAGGIPIPELSWKTGDNKDLPNKRFSIYGREMNVINASMDDTGRYVCHASNVMGQISYGSSLSILEPEKPVINAKYETIKIIGREHVDASIGSKITTIPGNKLTLTCNVNGLPEPKIVWKRNELLAQTGGITYEVSSLQTSDTGVYTCTAINLAGQVSATSHVIVLVGSQPSIATKKVNIKATEGENDVGIDIGGNLTTIVGTGVEIHCKVRGVPRPSVTWLLNGSVVLTTSVRFANKETNDLVLLGVTLDDIGFYTCYANNTFGQVSQTSFLDIFDAKGPVIHFSKRTLKDYDRTDFNIRIGDTLTTLIGTSVTITCDATGNPPPEITWTKSGSKLRKTRQFKAANNTLKIHVSSWSDTGQYECTATNAAGADKKISFVKFIPPEKPIITQNTSIIEVYNRKPVTMTIGSTLKTLTQTPIIITCNATGISTPKYTWLRKGVVVKPSKNFAILQNGKQLVLRSVTMEDSGIYMCSASNNAGKDSATSPILLTEPYIQEILSSDENITWYDRLPVSASVGGEIIALTGVQVTLACKARGFPEPTVVWRRDDDPRDLETDGQYKLVNNSLKIFAVQPSDSSRYRCIAKNLAGSVQSQTKLKVIDPEEPVILISNEIVRTEDSVPVKATIGDRIIVLSGTTVSIQCPVKGRPVPRVSWSNGGKFLISKDSKSVLELMNTTSVQSGEYTCTAISAIGADVASSTVVFTDPIKPVIDVSAISKIIQLTNRTLVNITIPDKVSVFVGTTVVIECPAVGIPKPKIRWEKDGKTLSTASAKNTLTVKTNKLSDKGIYTCIAENPEGVAQGSSTIDVIELSSPVIQSLSGFIDALDEPRTTNATIGQNVKTLTMTSVILKCPATGSPEPSISWSKSGDVIVASERIKMTDTGDLVIQKGRTSDSGNYKCTARSVAGLDTAISTVIIMSPTRPYISSSTGYIIWYEHLPFKSKIGNNLTTMKGRKLTLICPAKGMPRPNIMWYRGGERMINEENIVIKGDTLIISDLSVFDTDRYTCVAENYVGADAATSTLKVYDPVVPHIFTNHRFINALSGYSPVNVTVGQDVIAPVKSDVKLICPYKGVPRPKILWIKDHVTVTSDNTIEVDCNGTLKFHSIRAKDAGEYVCYIENFLGMDMALTHVRLLERSVPIIHKSNNVIPITDQSNVNAIIGDNVTALQTQTIEIKCNATGIPYPVITWTRDGVEIRSVGMYSIDKMGTLTITGAGRDGIYRCSARNDQGSDSGTTLITVKEPRRPEIVSPRDPKNIPFTHHKNVTINVRDNVTSLPGSNITIKCHAIGVPEPIVTWIMDDNVTVSGNKDSLVIQNAAVSDTGHYTCKAENIRGSVTATSHVTVMKPIKPAIDRPIDPRHIPAKDTGQVILSVGENVTSLVDSTIVIDCDADGEPTPIITWTKDDKDIMKDSKLYVFHKNGSLGIPKAMIGHTGKYVCIATNHGGEDREEAFVNIIAPQKPKILRPSKPIMITKQDLSPVTMAIGNNVTTLTNTTISMDCTASGIPTPTTTWTRNGKELSNGNEYRVYSNGTLVMNSIRLHDKGRYQCTAKNIGGEDSVTSIVHVLEPSKPRIVRPDQPRTIPPGRVGSVNSTIGDNITALTNSDITIDCPAVGIPPPEWKWSKDGETITVGKKYSVLENGTLLIRKVSRDESGTYQCTVENIAGDVDAKTRILARVPEEPKIIRPQKPTNITSNNINPVNMTVGSNLTSLPNTMIRINCPVSGLPSPTIQWYKDGKQISYLDGYKLDKDGSLVIENAQQADSGRYTCMADNMKGQDKETSNITVLVPVKPKIQSRDTPMTIVALEDKKSKDIIVGDKITTLIGSSVTIHCKVVAVPEAKITWLRNNQPIKTGNDYVMYENGTLMIDRSSTTLQGMYTCVATNNYGTDRKTSTVDAIAPRKPSIIKPTTPRNIGNIDRRPVSINITENVQIFTLTKITIDCISTGLPTPKKSWLLNGKPVAAIRLPFDNGTLVIANANKNDGGQYTCVARNMEGEDRATTNVIIKEPVKPEIIRKAPQNIPIGDGGPKQINVGSNITSITKANVNITCQARGLPTPEITWFKGNRRVNEVADRARVHPDGTLSLYGVTLSQTGVYTCHATNLDGKDTAESLLTVVQSEKPRIERPVKSQHIVTISPSKSITITDNITARPDSRISITCQSRGIPTPKITWDKDGEVIKTDSVDANGISTITIATSQERQSGKYSCTAKNIVGADKGSSQVLIMSLSKPVIKKSNVSTTTNLTTTKPYTLNIGGSVRGFPETIITIKCTVTGAPTPNIKWLKNGAEIKPTSKYAINKDHSLVIRKAGKGDTGRFTCEASNLVGKDSADSVFEIIDPIKPRITRPTVKTLESMDMHAVINTGVGTSITTLADNTIIIDCKATGLPTPTISWTKDFERIKSGEFYQVLSNGSLVIEKSQLEDDGIYTCTASNDFGRDQMSSSVEIIEAEIPVIQRTDGAIDKEDFDEIEVNIGHTVTTLSSVNITVNCSARGVPSPSIEWMNGGKMLNVKGPTLILSNVEQSAKYTCVAKNIAGNASASTMIHVKEPVIPSIQKAKKELVIHDVTSLSSNIGGSIETLSGSNLLLLCNATGRPKPKVKWSIGGSPITSGKRVIVNEGSLRMFNVQLNDSAPITCTATNIMGQDTATTELLITGILKPIIKKVEKTVKHFDKSKPAQVTVGSKLITGPGANVVISCPVLARPKATLSWQRKGIPIVPSKKFRMNGDKSKLTILGVEFEDAGAYVCTAFNRAGNDFAGMDMIVATPPVITNVRGSFDVTDIRELISITTGAVVTIPRGVSIRIKCETTGIPTPNITWFRVSEGTTTRQPISFNSNEISIDKDGFLTIERTNELDIAKYICVATNVAGSDEGVTHLNIGVIPALGGQWAAARKFTKPRIERIESMATVVRGSVVRLRCAVYGSPKPRITWIVVGNERKDRWRILPDGTLEIPKVDFSDEGNYTCIATNAYGKTYRSTNLTVLVPPKILDNFFSESFIKKKAELLHIKYSSITRLAIRRQKTRPAAVERGRNLIIGCPVIGRPAPSILWLRNGLKIRNDSKHLIAGGVLMIRSVSPADAGEYFCFVRNTAGEDGGGIDLHVRFKIVGRWLGGAWSECEDCYASFKGYKTRTVNCVDDKNSTVPVSYCAGFPRPATQQNCRARSCEAIWVSEPWSACSALCGGNGTKNRDVSCVYYKSLRPADGHCAGRKPTTVEPCNRGPCGQKECKDIVSYCRQIKERGLCQAFKQYCCHSCGGQLSIFNQ